MIDLLTGRTMSPLRMKAPEVVGAFHGVVSSKILGSIHKYNDAVFPLSWINFSFFFDFA
jgi:hypothetical protein